MTNPNDEPDVIDWNDLSDSDQQRASQLLQELNEIFDKYDPKKIKDQDLTEQ